MEIDWLEFLKREFSKGTVRQGKNGKELNIDCISDDCPSPKDHMFVNMGSDNPKHDKKFTCHRCGISGNYKAFLVAYYKRPFLEIIQTYGDLYGREGSPYQEVKRFSQKASAYDLLLEIRDKKAEKCIIDLPREYMELSTQTKFCKRRQVPMSIIRKFEIGICSSGLYRNRLIFPITTAGNKGFIAYSQHNKVTLQKYKILSKAFPNNKTFERAKKKILNPFGSLFSLLLFNYDSISQREKIIFVHEGVMDAIRTILHGYQAVAVFKSHISSYQALLISEKDPKEICLMLDSDVKEEDVVKNFNTLKDNCESKVSVVRLLDGDPDDIKTSSEFKRIIAKRKFIPFFKASDMSLQ